MARIVLLFFILGYSANTFSMVPSQNIELERDIADALRTRYDRLHLARIGDVERLGGPDVIIPRIIYSGISFLDLHLTDATATNTFNKLASLLASPERKITLRRLIITGRGATLASIRNFFSSLKMDEYTEYLDYAMVGLQDEDFLALADALACNKKLVTVSLRETNLTDASLRYLGAALLQNCTLNKIQIFGSGKMREGFEKFKASDAICFNIPEYYLVSNDAIDPFSNKEIILCKPDNHLVPKKSFIKGMDKKPK